MRGIVEVVTGGGKSTFAEMCIEYVLKEHPGTTVIVVVPSRALLDQWVVSLEEDLVTATGDVGAWSGDGRPNEPAKINVMVVNTARWAAPMIAANGKSMLIVDECHRTGSEANSEALSGEHLATLGLSATPEREYDDAFDEVIAPALGPIVFRYGLNEARQDEIVSPFNLVNVGVDLLPDEDERYRALTRRIIAASKKQGKVEEPSEHLKMLLRLRARVAALATMRIPVACSLIEESRGVRTIVFHEDIKAAENIRQILSKRNHSVTIYHSRMGQAARHDNLRLYRRGVFDVLVTCRALDEGMNVPSIEMAVIASATASSRQRVQRLGRVLRPSPGKDRAVIYTLYATAVEEQRLLQEAQNLTEAEEIRWQKGRVGDGTPLDRR